MAEFIHCYTLYRKDDLKEKQNGALLKLTDSDGNFGVADICPWPHLGDLNLTEELESRGPLFQRALQLAQCDLDARKNKVKLNLEKPVKNHYLMMSLDEPLRGNLVKIKGSRAIEKLAEFINSTAVKFRIDFNGQLTSESYFRFIELLSPDGLKRIECIEDPFPFDQAKWAKSPITIACDFLKAPHWPHKVLKPVREEVAGTFLYLTSAMDHPIGVAHGLCEAQKYPLLNHGFLTLDLYEATPFHKYFRQDKNELSLNSEGFGIGFDRELNEIVWEPLINYKSDSINEIFYENDLIKEYVDKNISATGYFLVPSSGSSHSQNESLKFYAISKANFLNSAERVNMQFNLNQEMNWGCVLPTYHVGGLSILARAHLAHSEVYFSSWKNFSIEWVAKNNIQLLSLVPTQLFDLVQKQSHAPSCLKYVFIGAAHLSPVIEEQARKLGWPLIVTYGMTETSSMIASRAQGTEEYIPFQGVEVTQSEDFHLVIKSNSLAEFSLQLKDGKVEKKSLIQNGVYKSEDIVELTEKGFRFLNRGADQIKINGIGVSLFKLRQKLEEVLIDLKLPSSSAALISLSHLRRGENLVLVTTETVLNVSEILHMYNAKVSSVERISKTHTLQTSIPVNELNKIKYQQLKEIVMHEIY